MDLKEAIRHSRDIQKKDNGQCAAEHSQLAGWLEELEKLREVAVQANQLYEICADLPIDFPSADRFVWTMGELKDALVSAGYKTITPSSPNEKVTRFLELLKEADSYMSDIFSKGSCFKLFKILKHLYPGAEPYKCGFRNQTLDQDAFSHVVTKIDGILYDINGVFEPEPRFPLVIPMNDEDITKAEKWSFSNNHFFLNCEECPYKE